MIKRLLIGLIFVSMALHSANQLGFLSYLYQQRDQIAYTLGWINEVPIAVCSHEYDFNTGLVVESPDQTDRTAPPLAHLSHEIHLFLSGVEPIAFDPHRPAVAIEQHAVVIEHRYAPPALSIFHPPS